MDAFSSSARYQSLCDRVGRLIVEYGSRHNPDLPAAMRLSGPKLRMLAPTVTHALKKLEFRGLANPELLEALCAITRDDPDLIGFHEIFSGLKSLSDAPHAA